MSKKHVLTTLTVVLSAFPAYGQEISIKPTSIGSYQLDKARSIWASASNDTNANRTVDWQFRYAPHLVIGSVDGKIPFKEVSFPKHKQLLVPIHIDSDLASTVAYETLKTESRYNIQKQNVRVLEMESINIQLINKDLHLPADVKISETTIPFGFGRRTVNLGVHVPERDGGTDLEKLKAWLRVAPIQITWNFNAKEITENRFQLSLESLARTSLKSKLDGVGGNTVYIHRDDLREIVKNVKNEINMNSFIENFSKTDTNLFDESLFKSLLERWKDKIENNIDNFSNNVIQSTFNKDDLKPDVIRSEINKLVDEYKDKKHYVVNHEYDAEGSANVFKVISGKLKGKAKWSRDELREIFRKHDIEIQFEGEKIVPKKIWLVQANKGDFTSSNSFVLVNAYSVNKKESISDRFKIDELKRYPVDILNPPRVCERKPEICKAEDWDMERGVCTKYFVKINSPSHKANEVFATGRFNCIPRGQLVRVTFSAYMKMENYDTKIPEDSCGFNYTFGAKGAYQEACGKYRASTKATVTEILPVHESSGVDWVLVQKGCRHRGSASRCSASGSIELSYNNN